MPNMPIIAKKGQILRKKAEKGQIQVLLTVQTLETKVVQLTELVLQLFDLILKIYFHSMSSMFIRKSIQDLIYFRLSRQSARIAYDLCELFITCFCEKQITNSDFSRMFQPITLCLSCWFVNIFPRFVKKSWKFGIRKNIARKRSTTVWTVNVITDLWVQWQVGSLNFSPKSLVIKVSFSFYFKLGRY
jgi:hypothetical protein